MSPERYEPKVRREMILAAAVEMANRPGGWFSLTRLSIARKAGCSEALISRHLGNMNSVRRSIMRIAIKRELTEIIAQSVAAHDGFAPKRKAS